MQPALPDPPLGESADAASSASGEAGAGCETEPTTRAEPQAPGDGACSFVRRHFVFGLFTSPRQAEEALRKLKVGIVQDGHLLLIAGTRARPEQVRDEPKPTAVQGSDGGDPLAAALLHKEIVMATPFAPLWQFLYNFDVGVPPSNGAAIPSITRQLGQNLASGGAVLIVSVESGKQERQAARALFDCDCNMLLTHEMSVRQRV